MDISRISIGCPKEVGRIPTVTERIRNGTGTELESKSESKDAAAPRKIAARERSGPDCDMIASRVAHLGAAKVREVCQIAWRWWKSGYRDKRMVSALVDLYVLRAGLILKPFAYFNAKGAGFAMVYASTSARVNEAEGARFKAEESRHVGSEDRAAMRARAEFSARQPRYDSSGEI